MSSWAERLETAIGAWRDGDLDGAARTLREVVVSGDAAAAAEGSHLLGALLQDAGDRAGALAAHRSVIAGGHPVFAQRSALALGMMLVGDGRHAEAHRPLHAAATGADLEITAMAEAALVGVLRALGDFAGCAALLDRLRTGGDAQVAALVEGVEAPRPPEDGGAREREAWQAYEAVAALLDGDDDPAGTVELEHALNTMLVQGIPELCSKAAFRLFGLYAGSGRFGECRRVIEHAIAVGDPGEVARAEMALGGALHDLGEHAEARDAYRRAAEDHRPEIRLDALIQLSKHVRSEGDEDGARALLRRVVDSGHPRFAAEATACLGQVLSEAGEVEEAVACWRDVLDGGTGFAPGAVHFLTILLHDLPAGDPRRDDITALLARATELGDPDAEFSARWALAGADQAGHVPDEASARAAEDCDAAVEHLRQGRLPQARALLRRVVDGDHGDRTAWATRALALLELREGDPEQAEELLAHLADSGDFTHGFAATVDLLLLAASGNGEPHPVLAALTDTLLRGDDTGVAALQECAAHPDASVAALGTAELARVSLSMGAPRSACLEMLEEAAASGDPLALSQAAVLAWALGDDGDDRLPALLRRAHQDGHPDLAPWVAHPLAMALRGRGQDEEALAAYDAMARGGHPGLSPLADGELVDLLEQRDDLDGIAAVHERAMGRGDRAAAAGNAWLLGFTRTRQGDLDAARAAFAHVPEDGLAADLAAAGTFARRLLDGDIDGAATALARITGTDGDLHRGASTQLAVKVALNWDEAGRRADAAAALHAALEHGHPRHRQEAALCLGSIHQRDGDHERAAEAFAIAAAAPGGEVEGATTLAHHLRGEALQALDDRDGAATAFLDALQTGDPDGPDRGTAVASAVRALARAGREPEACRVLDEHGHDGHPALTVADILEDDGDPDAAAAQYRRVIDDVSADPGDAARARAMLARVVAAGGDPAQAARLTAQAAETFAVLAGAGDREAAGLLALASCDLGGHLTAAGDAEGARRAFEKALSSDDPHIVAAAKEALGTATVTERALARLRDGDRDAAVELFTQEYGARAVAELRVALWYGEDAAARHALESAAKTGHAATAGELLTLVIEAGLDQGPDAVAGLYELAAEFCEPGDLAAVCHRLGVAYEREDRLPEAVETLARGADADHPDGLACLRRLVGVLSMTGDDAATEAAARRAAASRDQPTMAVGLMTLGELAHRRDDHTQAVARYREALRFCDTGMAPYIRVGLADCLRALDDTGAARRELEAVLAADVPGQAVLAGGALGALLVEAGDLAGAAEALGTAVTIAAAASPGEVDQDRYQAALNNLAAVARRADAGGAAPVAVRALHLAAEGGAFDDAREIAVGYATEAAGRGDLDAARAYCTGAAGFPPADPSPLMELADLLVEHGEAAEARAVLEPHISSADPGLRLRAATRLLPLLQEAGEDERALEVATLAAGQDTGDGDAASDMARALLGSVLGMVQDEQGDQEGALRTLAAAAEGGDPAARFAYADALARAGRPAEARQALAGAEDDPAWRRRVLVRAGLTHHDDDPDRARELYRGALDGPGDPDERAETNAKMYLGALAKKDRDWDEALRWYQRVVDGGGGDAALAAAHLGELAYWLGDRGSAIRFYELTLATGTQDAELVGEAAFRLGEIRHRDGDLDLARSHLERAAGSGDPGFAEQARSLLAAHR